MQNAYEPPKQFGAARPVVILWYRAYAGLMTLAYLLGLLGILSGLAFSGEGIVVESAFLIGLSSVLVLFFGFATFVPSKPWGWSIALGALILGPLTLCAAPMAVPILIHWLKPTTKAAFGRPPV